MIKTRIQKAIELEAKAKAIRRQEQAFWDDVELRADEVKERLKALDKFDAICKIYNACTEDEKDTLYKYLLNDRQIDLYQKSLEGNADRNETSSGMYANLPGNESIRFRFCPYCGSDLGNAIDQIKGVAPENTRHEEKANPRKHDGVIITGDVEKNDIDDKEANDHAADNKDPDIPEKEPEASPETPRKNPATNADVVETGPEQRPEDKQADDDDVDAMLAALLYGDGSSNEEKEE